MSDDKKQIFIKRQEYTYRDDGVTLSFGFDDSENIVNQKRIFIGLMEKAIQQLNNEIN